MLHLLPLIRRTFLGRQLDFRVRLFNLLAIAGTLISLLIFVLGLFNDASIGNLASVMASSLLSFGLLLYSYRSGRYHICYIITIVAVFLVFFPAFFFTAGGYQGGMPSFFVFAVLFTIFMMDGKQAFLFAGLELAVYLACCLVAYWNPGLVVAFDTEQDRLVDVIIGFFSASVVLGVTLFLHFRLYNEQQRQLEAARREAERLSQVKSTFLANMSHEIRTPINVMLGMNEMVLRESLSPAIVGYARKIQTAGKTLRTLIQNVLDVSRIEAGKVEVRAEPYRLAELTDDLALLGGEQAARRGLAFRTRADPALPAVLRGDSACIRQVVVNFISNAVKYTDTGSITLTFGQKPGRAPGEIVLCIAVADTGIGIRREDQVGLFDAFTRVALPAHRNIEGTGLGLAIARDLTRLMDGHIQLHSVWGEGSCFTVEIPQGTEEPQALGERAPDEAAEAGESFTAPDARILVVDDSRENLEVAQALLRRTQLQVDTATGGWECLEKMKTAAYHAILLDHMMPDLDGIETFRRIRQEYPGSAVPVIALTANAVAGVKETFLREGFAAYLTKPIEWQEMERAMLGSLPPELIHRTRLPARVLPTQEAQQELKDLLACYDIQLEEGLRYLNGDLLGYVAIARVFGEEGAGGEESAPRLLEACDWAGLAHLAHALKSRAKAVGADALQQLALWVERYSGAGDAEYLRHAVPLLVLEWRRTREGVQAFLRRAGELLGREECNEPMPAASEGEVLRLIRAYRGGDAERELERLLVSGTVEPQAHGRWTAALAAVREFDYERAEQALLGPVAGEAPRGPVAGAERSFPG